MTEYRISHAARDDIVEILAWTGAEFGEQARRRYEALLVAALRDAAKQRDGVGSTARPELGVGVRSWHLTQSREKARAGAVRRPRHIIVYRLEGDRIVVGRILHEAMDARRRLTTEDTWD